MTRKQEWCVNRIRREAETLWGGDTHEVKRFDVSENEYFVAVIAEVGRKGDEGTLAEIFCRDRIQVFIGKRGKMEYPVHKQLKNGDFRNYHKKYSNFLSTSVDQKYY